MYRTNHLPASLVLAFICILSSIDALALSGDKDQPIQLAADSVDVNESTGISVYKGDVDLRQGSIHLQADKVTVHQKGANPSKIIAEGNPVKFKQTSKKGPVTGRAKRAEYAVNSEQLLLIGNASLTQGKDTMKSDRIIYDRVKAVVKAGAAAKGSGRVNITIQSPKKKNKE